MFKGLMKKVKGMFADDLSEASVQEVMAIFCDDGVDEDKRLEAANELSDFSSRFSDLNTELPSTTRLANETYEQLLEMLDEEDDDEWVYAKAIEGMNEIVNVCRYEMDKRLLRDSVEALIACLSDEEADETRTHAAGLLGSLDDVLPEGHCQEAIEAIREGLDDDSDEVRGDFLMALGSFGNKAAHIWHEVAEYLGDRSARVRDRAVSALWMIGNEEPDPAVLDKIIDLLANDRSGEVRSSAADTLGHLGSGHPGVIEALIDALEDDDARHMALFAFSALGEEADAAVPHIEAFLGDDDHDDSAEMILQNIGTPRARAALRAHGRDEE